MIHNSRQQEGFTLIELIVATAVFATVITVVSSIFINSVGSQRKNINHQEVLDNGRYILENIGRAIRQSTINTQDGSGTSLTITHPAKGSIFYTLNAGQILENSVALNSASVIVKSLNFLVQNNDLNNIQPRVTISISLKNAVDVANVSSAIDLQTTITPRNLK